MSSDLSKNSRVLFKKKFSQEIFSWIEHGTINIPYPINCGLTRNYIRWRKFSPVLFSSLVPMKFLTEKWVREIGPKTRLENRS